MAEIKFDLGKNIVETARASGVPEFAARKVASTISYSIADIPREISVHYTRPGFEVTWQPVFGLSMYASEKNNSITDSVNMSLNIDAMSDGQAQAFTEATIAQFQKGKWKRYPDPELGLLLTGRSSYLDEAGALDVDASGAPDPAYKLTLQDWKVLSNSLNFYWHGDGVVARYSINNSPGQDGKPAYRMRLEFELLDVKVKRDADNLAAKLKAGDAKGWDSTAQHEANKKKNAERVKRLIANAIKRGDSVVQP